MFTKSFVRRLGIGIIIFITFLSFDFWGVERALAGASCSVSVSVNNSTGRVDFSGTVRETTPGLDPSQTYITLYDDAPGSPDEKDGSSNSSSVTVSYYKTVPNGTYRAYVQGTSVSNPGAIYSDCFASKQFTVAVPVYQCSDGVDNDGDGLVDYPNDPGCSSSSDDDEYNPPPEPEPGPFNMTTSYCFGWPNPKIESNFNTSEHATSYTLQKWNGSSWQNIYNGSYQQVDSYGDSNISMGSTYYYQVVAHNSEGDTTSNNYLTHTPTPSDCGQVLYSLSVSTASGVGTITADVSEATGSGINCGSDCSESYDQRDPWVTVTATAATGYTFSSWNGACATQGASCSLEMNQNRSTSANFSTNNFTLSVSVSGPGSVSSNPAGINSCTSQCSASFPYQQQVELTPNTPAGSTFAGWSGACSGTGTCTVRMDTNRSVGATFTTNSYTLSLSKSGTGTGTVTSNPSGISCNASCSSDSASYNHGTSVTLTATPTNAGSAFAGWSGACSGTGTCTVTMTSAQSVTATFNTVAFNYSLSNSGTTNVTKDSGNAYGQNTITKTLVAGLTQSVDLSLSGVPSGVSYSISSKTCSPTCTSVITFTVAPSTTVGTYPITVTGSPLGKTTNFNLVIEGAPFAVSCSVNPTSNAVLGQDVTWSATADGGVAPLTYRWSGDGVPTSPAPSVNPYTMSYSTIGTKNVAVTITDAESVESTCPSATIEVTFDPNFEEF